MCKMKSAVIGLSFEGCLFEWTKFLEFIHLGKWFYLKKALFFIFLSLRKYRMNRMKNRGENAEIGDAGYGMKSRMTVEDMDCVQTLVDDPMVNIFNDEIVVIELHF